MIENYRRARAYLYKIDHNLYRDVLHDAYVTYYSRTGLNLFERSITNVIGVVKNQYFENLRKGMFKRNGERFPYQFTDFDNHSVTTTTPIDLLIAEETKQKLYNKVNSFKYPQVAKTILDLRIEGYNTKEISEVVNINLNNVNKYTRDLQKDRENHTNKVSDKERREIKRLSASGLTLNQICNKLGRSMTTVWMTVNDKNK